ncbi:MAG: 2-oxoglutarate dehydrogenase E1 component [Planctomycetota bacterium]|jgi:2-oxoglutarate dehydrogenase E1 component|nr:MAG: 2-oxoglutarate dehydrogenase E1 component [Planctomycetota bacterium]
MNTTSLDYIDDLYLRFINDPTSVSETWRRYFEDFSLSTQSESLVAEPVPSHAYGESSTTPDALWLARMQERVDQLVREYRVRGHLAAKIDPLGFARKTHPELDPSAYGLTPEDLQRPFAAPDIHYTTGRTLNDIIDKLRETYCRSIGAQFMHIDNRTIREWLQRRMEATENRLQLSRDVQTRIYTRLTDATLFEEFVRKKYTGSKTFSLEGSESLIPLLDLALEKAGEHGVRSIVMAMAHRGRLNVLANIMGKRAQSIFWSFDDPNPEMFRGGGDVKYHMGYSSDWTTRTGKKLHISLCFNPSHLEFVNPVALGRCRSKQDRDGDTQRTDNMTILIHGDAAFIGEGVVQETLNLSELQGYRTGGTLHVVINNQVGFTTEPDQGRSCTYATDIAKMLEIPIFHVNGEDPEAVAQVVAIAMDFRKQFEKDVVIDMYAYRKLGHNESDEPRFTQPLMYSAIDAKKGVRESYLDHLLSMNGMSRLEADAISEDRHQQLTREFELAKSQPFVHDLQSLTGIWQGYFGGTEPTDLNAKTNIAPELATEVLEKTSNVPTGFHVNKKIARVLEDRREMAIGKTRLDWAAGEALAFGSLSIEGHPLRLSGQDVERGTFSHRHAVLHDVDNNAKYMGLGQLRADQARVEIVNSPLSEAAVLGFEYGYSLDCPEGLVMWEAQFGDFWNVAQCIVDQFIVSAEDKWNRLSRLVMLLPHGFEGQGPEHCSARLERLLLLTAEHNIIVAQPSTPAQYFHLLRRQVKSKWSKPLIVLTPKSLLRHPGCTSVLDDIQNGSFQKILPDDRPDNLSTRRILISSGKAYYDLFEERRKLNRTDVALVRIEQFYPMDPAQVVEALSKYPTGTPVYWYQDEPSNMGAWQFIKMRWGDDIMKSYPLSLISRPESASPATGSLRSHKLEERDLLTQAFAGL